MNQCIHGIDLLRWMMGEEIDEVYGVTRQQFHHYLEAEDIGMAVVKFQNGAVATIEGTTNVYPKNLEETLYLFGENGTVKLPDPYAVVCRSRRMRNWKSTAKRTSIPPAEGAANTSPEQAARQQHRAPSGASRRQETVRGRWRAWRASFSSR